MEFELSTTSHGKPCALYEGYSYIVKRRTKQDGITYWRCSKNRSTQCRGFLKTKNNEVLHYNDVHQCGPPDAVRLELRKALSQAKQRAESEDTAVSQIVSEELSHLHCNVTANINLSKRTLYHHRAKTRGHLKKSKSPQESASSSSAVLPTENDQKNLESGIECKSASEQSEENQPATSVQSASNTNTPVKNTNTPVRGVKRKLTQPNPSTSENKTDTNEHVISFMKSAVDKLQEISSRASQVVNKDDSFDHFGRYVASMLRSAGQPTAMRLQQDIMNMIANALCATEYPIPYQC